MTRQLLRLPSREKSDLALLVQQYPGAEAEYRFCAQRRWRFDYCWPTKWVALEFEGIYGCGKSRHTAGGYVGDCEKYSVAAILGWCLIRVTADMVRDGRAADLLKAAHEGRN